MISYLSTRTYGRSHSVTGLHNLAGKSSPLSYTTKWTIYSVNYLVIIVAGLILFYSLQTCHSSRRSCSCRHKICQIWKTSNWKTRQLWMWVHIYASSSIYYLLRYLSNNNEIELRLWWLMMDSHQERLRKRKPWKGRGELWKPRKRYPFCLSKRSWCVIASVVMVISWFVQVETARTARQRRRLELRSQ